MTASGVSAQSATSLQRIIEKARSQTAVYHDTFQNLIGDEIKTFETKNERGESGKQVRVRSELLVYRSDKVTNRSSELRIVTEVDGKPVPDAISRSERLLAELGKSTTFFKEIEKLESESGRYDRSIIVYGATINQGAILDPLLQPAVEFSAAPPETIDGREMLVINYVQTVQHPLILFNPSSTLGGLINFDVYLPNGIKASDLRLRGTMWIDSETYQLKREERNVTMPIDTSIPLATMRYDYAPSEFGILLPRSIFVNFNKLKGKPGSYKIKSRDTALLEYSKFRKTNVEIKISDDETPEPTRPNS